MSAHPEQVDTLIVGRGIAGLQSALDLAEQGYQVAVVERQPSTGGAMIGLSKVFPTLDCADANSGWGRGGGGGWGRGGGWGQRY